MLGLESLDVRHFKMVHRCVCLDSFYSVHTWVMSCVDFLNHDACYILLVWVELITLNCLRSSFASLIIAKRPSGSGLLRQTDALLRISPTSTSQDPIHDYPGPVPGLEILSSLL